MKTTLIVLLCAISLCGQPAVTPPQLGFVADANRSLRPLLGIAGNFLLGEAVSESVVDVASSGSYAMLKTDSSLLVLDASGVAVVALDADAGRALFAFAPDGRPRCAWLTSSGVLQIWKGDHFEGLAVSQDVLSGEVLAVAQDHFVVKRSDGLWMVEVAADGSLQAQAALPGIAGPVMLDVAGGLLYTDNTTLVVRAPDGGERRIELGFAPGAMAPLQPGWVRVLARDSRDQFAVRVTPGLEQVYQLPEGPACCGN